MKPLQSVQSAILCAAFVTSFSSWAQTPPATPPPVTPAATPPDAEEQSGGDGLDGWGLSVGLGVENYKTPYVQAASTNGTNRVVTIDDQRKTGISMWSVGNWTVDACEKRWRVWAWIPCSDYVKPGFYVGAKIAGQDGNFLDAASIGFHYAFIKPNSNKKPNESGKNTWNIGVGIVSHKTRVLGAGITEGQPLPADFTDVKYRNGTETSWMVMISKGINFD